MRQISAASSTVAGSKRHSTSLWRKTNCSRPVPRRRRRWNKEARKEGTMAEPRITGMEVHEYAFTLQELGADYNAFNLVYTPDSTLSNPRDRQAAGQWAGSRRTRPGMPSK